MVGNKKIEAKDLPMLNTILIRRCSLIVLMERRLSDDKKLAKTPKGFPWLTKIRAETVRMVGRVSVLIDRNV